MLMKKWTYLFVALTITLSISVDAFGKVQRNVGVELATIGEPEAAVRHVPVAAAGRAVIRPFHFHAHGQSVDGDSLIIFLLCHSFYSSGGDPFDHEAQW